MIKELLHRILYWWVGHEWVADTVTRRMVRRRPDGSFEHRSMTDAEAAEEFEANCI